MDNNQISLFKDLIKINNLNLPGFDVSKSFVFMFILFLMLLFVTDNPIFNLASIDGIPFQDKQNLMMCSRFSFIFLILAMAMCVFSFSSVFKYKDIKIDTISSCRFIFLPKILINISLILFFITVALWIFSLGGIRHSPYGTLLSMSPVLMSIQFYRDKHSDYSKLYDLLILQNANIKTASNWKQLEKWTKHLGVAPLMIIVLTLILGCFNFNLINVSHTDWFNTLYYSLYFLSVIIAFVGVLPKRITKKFTDYFI